MRPGQLEPNEFEMAILARISTQHPSVHSFLGSLHVLSREFTGVGSYTKFLCNDVPANAAHEQLGLDGLISIPGVPNGLGAVLFCTGGKPQLLELFTYGNDLWDGVFDGFSIDGAG